MSFRNYYDTSTYGRSRDTSRTNTSTASTNRPTAVTAKYVNSSASYKSSNIPIISSERSSTKDETPISTIASRYANYNKCDKSISKYEKKDYSKLSVPSIITSRDKSRDVSPVSTASKYSLSRPARRLSPDRKTVKNFKEKIRDTSPGDRDKDIPSKADKSSSYNSLTNYKLYPRTTNYTRPSSRAEKKPDISVNRYAIANRLSSSYLRSPSTASRTSVIPSSHNEDLKSESEKPVQASPVIVVEENCEPLKERNEESLEENENEVETVIVVTRHTSPTPPGSSAYVRSRRADMAKTIEKTITRTKRRPEMFHKEIQSDRLDDSTRHSRYGSTARTSTTNWSYYSPNVSSYTGYAGRYSTQYSTLRENLNPNSPNERSSRSRSIEPPSKENIQENISCNNSDTHFNEEMIPVNGINEDDDSSEIIINVNLKLKRAKSPPNSTDLISPEIIITNSQLPPQAPKTETSTKLRKCKIRKSSTDLSTENSSKKKVIKKRSKSVSSTESDQGSEVSEKSSIKSNANQKTYSSNLQKSPSKLKHSKSRESNSPESNVTLSTQSSLSEDENIIKTNELSRTTADEMSVSTDKSPRQSSPLSSQKNDNSAEEAKSFLIRALAPVTNLFKRHHESNDNNRGQDSSMTDSTSKDISNLPTESEKSGKIKNIVATTDNNLVKLTAIRHIGSEEKTTRQEAEIDNINDNFNSGQKISISDQPRKLTRVESAEKSWWSEVNGESKTEDLGQSHISDNCNLKRTPIQSKFTEEEKPWWLDSCANIPEGIERLTPPRKSSSDSDKSEKFNFFKVRRIESGDQKDWWLTSNENSSISNKAESQKVCRSGSERNFPLKRIRHVESGERPWWLSSGKNIPEGIEKLPTPPLQQESDSSDSEEVEAYIPRLQVPPFPLNLPDDEPLGDRRSPEGLETPKENEYFGGRGSPYENSCQYRRGSSGNTYQRDLKSYISRYTDIDDILGTSGQIYSPFMDSILARRTGQAPFEDDECEEIDPTQVKIHDSTPQRPVIKKIRSRSSILDYREELDDATLQVFKDGDYGPYLDLDSTLGEQDEELEGLQDSRKNAIVLRTQITVRVHAIIEQLLRSQGRELRKALFSLKQILQSDKDLVHEFVANKGLDCMIKVGSSDDNNHNLEYVLRALGQVLLYVDGMHGVMEHKPCVQWLYSLISNKFRHVIKTALKLLLVFVEYTKQNSLLLIDAIKQVDSSKRRPVWFNIMKILQDLDASDAELIIYATTLINRCLNNVSNIDIYYDQIDSLQNQGIDKIIQLYMSKQGTDLDLLRQFQIFEAVLLFEDGDESGTAIKQLDEATIALIRHRNINLTSSGRRTSIKHQMGVNAKSPAATHPDPETKTQNNNLSQLLPSMLDNKENKELTTALKRRRDRYARQAQQIMQQQEMMHNSKIIYNGLLGNTNNSCNGNCTNIINYPNINETHRYTKGLTQRIQNGTLGHSVNSADTMRQKQLENVPDTKEDRGFVLNKEHSIKDIAQRLTSPVINSSPDDKSLRVSDMAGIVSKAKEGLAKSQSKEILKSPQNTPIIDKNSKVSEINLSESILNWAELERKCINRPYYLCDLDFSDLEHDSDDDITLLTINAATGPPPPPPNIFPPVGVPPPPPGNNDFFQNNMPAPPPKLSQNSQQIQKSNLIIKNKKTVKLFWKEIQENPTIMTKEKDSIWDTLPEVTFDKGIIEHLFEAKCNDLIIKKLSEPKRNLILDTKRSNAINIALKKLPTPQTIKAAIIKMDATVVSRESIEKLLTMLPTDEEKLKIQEAQYANPNLPLGSAEQFLLTLASINELSSRLKLWVFKLDFDNLEKEVAEPLLDLKQGIELLKINNTFKVILSTLRSVGSFLNGNYVKGFRLEYLSKVAEVKDTVHKHPLLYHVCEIIIEKFPESTDFFSEVGPVIRASKVDFDVLYTNLDKLESECKEAWYHMQKIAKHDASNIFKAKINDFIIDAAERIILLKIFKRKIMSRYAKFLLYLGVPPTDLSKTKPSELLKVIAEFALEFRTTRERVLQQLQKKANHRERNKTRGKMIIDLQHFSSTSGDATADIALKELLRSDPDTDSLTERRRKSHQTSSYDKTDSSRDGEIMESLIQSTKAAKPKLPRNETRRGRVAQKQNFAVRTSRNEPYM